MLARLFSTCSFISSTEAGASFPQKHEESSSATSHPSDTMVVLLQHSISNTGSARPDEVLGPCPFLCRAHPHRFAHIEWSGRSPSQRIAHDQKLCIQHERKSIFKPVSLVWLMTCMRCRRHRMSIPSDMNHFRCGKNSHRQATKRPEAFKVPGLGRKPSITVANLRHSSHEGPRTSVRNAGKNGA